METGFQGLGSGGEAKASPADRDAARDEVRHVRTTRGEQTGRGGTMDEAMGAQHDPDLMVPTGEMTTPGGSGGSLTVDDDMSGTPAAQLGAGETAAYGETVENEQLYRADEEA